MKYVSLDSDEKILSFISSLNPSSPIAVDLEGEFNLHIYGEHLCLIQIFDGKDFYIIDPRSKAVSEKAVVAFFTSDIQKVWFDVQSDNSLIFKVYGITINNVFDVRALAKALGFMGNLISLEEEFLKLNKDSVDKKKLQQTNWLKRPLTDEQIEYALSDVEYLLELKRVLLIVVEEKGVSKEAEFLLHSACKKPKISPPFTSRFAFSTAYTLLPAYFLEKSFSTNLFSYSFSIGSVKLLPLFFISSAICSSLIACFRCFISSSEFDIM